MSLSFLMFSELQSKMVLRLVDIGRVSVSVSVSVSIYNSKMDIM
jgi:precorrin-6B methylase 2